MTDSKDGNIFHFVAHANWTQAFDILPEIEYMAQQRDKNGDLPIHIASKMGHVNLIEKLYTKSQSLNKRGQTILHVAAKYGNVSAVKYILGHPELGKLINAVDYAGNTALHLAAMHSQPAALIHLLLDKRIQLGILNNKCLTELHIVEEWMARGKTLRNQLEYLVLYLSHEWQFRDLYGTRKVRDLYGRNDSLILRPEAQDEGLVCSREMMPNRDILKDFINSRMVVATLVAIVTFAAGFAVPGGFNGSDAASKDVRGMATMLDKRLFQAFAICNTIAMFCSMTTVITLNWAHPNDVKSAMAAYNHSILPITIALPAMSIAFLTGVALTVGKLPWLANTIFYLGLVFLLNMSSAKLLELPPLFMLCGCGLLKFWLILACIYLWGVETYIYDDTEDDGMAIETSASQPADGAGESKTGDSATAKCGDVPPPPSH